MTNSRHLALAVLAIVVTAGIVAISWPSADADDRGRSHRAERRPATSVANANNSTVAGNFVLPVDKTQPLLRVRGLGRFTVRCLARHRLETAFRSTVTETLFVTVERGGARSRAAVVDPGERFRLAPSGGATTTQQWQLARVNEAFSSVALVFISSSPPYGAGNPTCAVSAYGIGPTEQRRK